MASIRELRTTVQVRWLEDGQAQRETFADRKSAEGFASAVEAAGSRWPDGWVPGIGWERPTAFTVSEWMTAYIDSPRCGASEETKRRYRSHVRDHVAGARLGAMDLASVKRADVAAWLDELVAKGLSWKTTKNLRGELSTAFTAALAQDPPLIERQPVEACPIPKTAAKPVPPVFLTEPEVAALLASAPAHRHAVYWTLVDTGIRWGELRELRNRRVLQAANGRVYLEVFKARKHSSDGNHRTGTTKTKSGKRKVSVSRELGRVLLGLAATGDPGGYLFPDLESDGSEWRLWSATLTDAGLIGIGDEGQNPRIHDLRHTHASQLLADGVSIFKVSKRLGHATSQITMDLYGHLQVEDDEIGAMLDSKRRTLRSIA
jgi:integrase